MRPQSAKAKGRRLQQYLRDMILARFDFLEPDDVRNTSMGASGEDILLSPAARKVFPFAPECKNQERLNVWDALAQAEANAGDHMPLLVFKRNRSQTYAAMPLDALMNLLMERDALRAHRGCNCGDNECFTPELRAEG
jgi:hypothetical protein